MPLVCRNCKRANPPEAHYCYWDGAVLDGQARASGPIAVGAQPFLSPFVFPSGRQCRNFDELVRTCYSEWKEALELLRKGYLEGFFGAQGRADLALAAKQAHGAADLDRGLDDLLSKLPCSTRESAKLFAQPQEVSLGQIARSADRRFVLHIENQGMGLLHGTVACDDSAWLALGEGAGSPRKVFQCLNEFALTVQVHGKALRAGNKTQEGRISIESNGGSMVIIVRVDVPVTPFPSGALAGATSPRQVAEKAKANPKEAAQSFESGAVAAWYESNGWIYPVQGPASSGLGAIQQFFEALGLVKAPVVEISETSIHLQGAPGASLEHVLQVQAREKRPVFAHATTGVPWLRIGRIVLGGRTARIPLKVPSVPASPGEQLHGKVQVTSNGHQRFVVEVSLTVAGRASGRGDRHVAEPVLAVEEVLPVMPVVTTPELPSYTETIAEVVPVEIVSPAPVLPAVHQVVEVLPVETGRRGKRRTGGEIQRKTAPVEEGSSGGILKHLLPLAFVLLLLLGMVAHDLWVIVKRPPARRESETVSAAIDPDPYIAIRFHDGPKEQDDKMPMPTMRFGLVMLREKDPEHPDRLKKLTFDEWGRTNNTCLRVDGKECLFGQPPRKGEPAGAWAEMKGKLTGETAGRPREGLASSWLLSGLRIKVTQEVEIVANEQSRRLDTCLVRYVIENTDTRPHQVGIRFLLDTYIGANDGVPFTIPGASGTCDSLMQFDRSAEVPDFIQALEKDDPRKPGTVAYLQFRLGKQIESPERVTLGGWPNQELRQFGYSKALSQLTKWDVPFISMKELDRRARTIGKRAAFDSAVTMYWNERELEPGKSRTVGFTYGLGNVDTSESEGHLLLTVGGRLVRNGEFTLTALVHNPASDEKLTLTLPPGFSIIEGSATQDVPAVPAGATRPDSPVTWRIRAGDDGKYELAVQSSKGVKQKLPIVIRTRGVFD
jgi:hypothetical protein